MHVPACQRCVDKAVACTGPEGKACDNCRREKAKCDFAANVGRGAVKVKVEPAGVSGRPKRARAVKKPVAIDQSDSEPLSSSSSSPTHGARPVKRSRSDLKGKGKMRNTDADSGAKVRRALRKLAREITTHQTAMQTAFNGIVTAINEAEAEILDA